MDAMHRGAALRLILPFMAAAALAGVTFLGGCARVASAPAKQPQDVATSGSTKAETEAALAAKAQAAASEPSPAPETDTVEVSPDAAAAQDEDDAPPEDTEPSPLDELPENLPETPAGVVELEHPPVAQELPPTYDIPMVLNDKVAAYVEYFTGDHRDIFAASLARSMQYLDDFKKIFQEEGVPTDLVYMAHVESAFKTNAYSRARAKGIFQFITGTARRYGLRVDFWVDERSDPDKSARAAALYLKDLHGIFGDWYLALAAYNAGEGKIQRAVRRTGKSDFWAIAGTRSLRRETREYVPAILAATLIAKQPARFGFTVEPDPPPPTETVKIDGQVDLRVLAKLVDLDPDVLRKLNPSLRRGVTPPGNPTEVRVPAGSGPALAEAYAALPVKDRMIVTRHVVSRGQTLSTIGRHYGVSVRTLQAANQMGRRTLIHPGQVLIVPSSGASRYYAESSAPAYREHPVRYRVRRGDTLGRIARRYHTSAAAIARASGISVSSTLSIGQRLTIPASRARSTVVASATKGSHRSGVRRTARGESGSVVHTVRRGETLYSIAGRFGVSVRDICALNGISAKATLYPGTQLTIR